MLLVHCVCMSGDGCEYCKNAVTRNSHNPYKDVLEEVCEVHYAYIKPQNAKVNPSEMDHCVRCGTLATNKRGDKQRLIEHHVNYALDLTVQICDSCHSEIHQMDDSESVELPQSPYLPRDTSMVTGVGLEPHPFNNEKYTCPACGSRLSYETDMGNEKPICPNSDCLETTTTPAEVYSPDSA